MLKIISEIEEQLKVLKKMANEDTPRIKGSVKRAPSAFASHMKEVVLPLYKEAMKDRKGKAGFHLKVGGYLKDNEIAVPTLEDVSSAIEYLLSHPDHKSKSATKKAVSVVSSEEEVKKVVVSSEDEEHSVVADVVAKIEEATKTKTKTS